MCNASIFHNAIAHSAAFACSSSRTPKVDVERVEPASWCLERVPVKVVAGATSQPSCCSSGLRSPRPSKSGHWQRCNNLTKSELAYSWTSIQRLGCSKRATAAAPTFAKCSCTCRCCGCCGFALGANAMSPGMRGSMGTTPRCCPHIHGHALPHLWFMPLDHNCACNNTEHGAQKACIAFWPQPVPPLAKFRKLLPCH